MAWAPHARKCRLIRPHKSQPQKHKIAGLLTGKSVVRKPAIFDQISRLEVAVSPVFRLFLAAVGYGRLAVPGSVVA